MGPKLIRESVHLLSNRVGPLVGRPCIRIISASRRRPLVQPFEGKFRGGAADLCNGDEL